MSKAKSPPTEPALIAGPEALTQPTAPGIDLAEKIKELVRLSKEQGQLTFEDVNEILTEEHATPNNLDHIFAKLRELEIEVVDSAEVDRVKPVDKEEEEEEPR